MPSPESAGPEDEDPQVDFGFLYRLTRRNLEYGSPALLCLVTVCLLSLASERTIIFAVVLVIGVLFALLCLVYETATSLHLFGFVLTWYYWLIYSYGYSASSSFPSSERMFVDVSPDSPYLIQWGAGMVFFKLVLGLVLHGVGVLRTMREEGMGGMSLVCVAIFVVLYDAVPCADNNLFYEGWRNVMGRLLGLLVVYALNTYRTERWKAARRDNTIRSFLQLEYVMFATPWLALVLWAAHVCLILYDVRQQLGRDEKDRERRAPSRGHHHRTFVPLEDVTTETHAIAREEPVHPSAPAVLGGPSHHHAPPV